MESQVIRIEGSDWQAVQGNDAWRAALEAGKVLFSFQAWASNCSPRSARCCAPTCATPARATSA